MPRFTHIGVAACLALALVACSGEDAYVETTTTYPLSTTTSRPTPTTTVDETPAWPGFEATHGISDALAVMARGPIDVFSEPGATAPHLTLERTTILGTSTVLGVVSPPHDDWIEVMLPVRPNGSTGWVRSDSVDLYVADGLIHVDLSDRQLIYLVDGVEVLRTEVGIGSDYNRTPEGEFFVTDNVTLANPNSPWGPHALGLSARSDTITEYNGGDGIIGIHGTNNPSSIGGDISLGCVRLPNDMISALHEMVPIGTRVTVTA